MPASVSEMGRGPPGRSIKRSPTIGIRLYVVFCVYAIFAAAVIVRSAYEVWWLLRGGRLPEERVVDHSTDHTGVPTV